MKKTICGFLAAVFLLSGIGFGSIGNANAASDIPEQKQLENFLAWVYYFADQYDYQNNQTNDLFGSLANLLSVAFTDIWGIDYPNIDFETGYTGYGLYGRSARDPLGKFNENCTRTNKAGLDWLGKFIFNIPDYDWEADKQNEFASGFYYEYGDHYWAGEGGIGWEYDPTITILDCKKTADDYYKVAYYVQDNFGDDGYAYALLQLKDYEGKRYWSLYHNSINEEEVFDDLVTVEYRESRYGYGESYLILPNGRRIVSSDNKLYDQYSEKVIATDVYGSFYSNGTFVYYNKYTYQSGKRAVHRLDLRTYEDMAILEGKWAGTSYVAPELSGVYKDKYIYYDKLDNYGSLYKGEPYAENIDSSKCVFDIETGEEINDGLYGNLWVLEDHIYTIPYCGDPSPLELMQYDPDGGDPIRITDKACGTFKIYGTKLIYSAYNDDFTWNNIKYQIKEYDLQKGTTSDMTEYYRDIHPVEIYKDYAVFESLASRKKTTVSYNRPSFYVIYNEGEHDYLKMEGSILDYIDEYNSTTYSPELSLTLLCLSFAAYNDKGSSDHQQVETQAEKENTNIYKSFVSLGFKDIKLNEYYYDPNDSRYGEDNCAYTIGHQKMDDGRNLIAVAIRGSYGDYIPPDSDWRSDFNYGANGDNDHFGIAKAAKKVKRGIEKYVDTYKLDNNVYIITGHSRGGGVGNLITKYMDDEGVPIENVYNYNFGSLNTTKNLQEIYMYPNIFNICNEKDGVTQLPPYIWPETWCKYGQSLWFSRNSLEVQNATLFWGTTSAPTEILIDPGAHLLPTYLSKLASLPEIEDFSE